MPDSSSAQDAIPGALTDALADGAPHRWLTRLAARAEAEIARHGRAPAWRAALAAVPPLPVGALDLAGPAVACDAASAVPDAARARLREAIEVLRPWRKGPFRLWGEPVDAEWRSDRKWSRVAAAAAPFHGRRVLDVGCGNGYYAWRLAGAGARCVLGLDPAPLAVLQFRLVQRCAGERGVLVLPGADTDIEAGLACFDTVLSLGVLYHRRDPGAHLAQLRDALAPGGECVLETLVVEGDTPLVPAGRYAGMRNVHVVPAVDTVEAWLAAAGFAQVRCADVTVTTTAEQRVTTLSTARSLADFLDPADPGRTVEGHPAPRRALFLAEAV